MRARDERELKIFRVVDDGADEKDDVAVRLGSDFVEVLGDVRGRAVRDAVLSQIALAEVRRRHEERAADGRSATATAAASTAPASTAATSTTPPPRPPRPPPPPPPPPPRLHRRRCCRAAGRRCDRSRASPRRPA